MIVAVFGPRDKPTGAEGRIASAKKEHYDNYEYVAEVLQCYDITKVVTGGGYGVEQLALRYASLHDGISHKVVPPSLALHGHKAWPLRNREILGQVDTAILLWDGRDRWYIELLAMAVELQKVLHVHHVE